MSGLEYSAVIRGSTVIASHGEAVGFTERDLVRRVPATSQRIDQKITAGKLFSFSTISGLVFAAVSPQAADKQRPLAFLDALSRRWVATLGPASASATDHSLDGTFRKDFASLFDKYAKTTDTAELARELDDTQRVLTESVTKALDRGAELESVSLKTEAMLATSDEFGAQSTSLKLRKYWEWVKLWGGRLLALVAIVYIIFTWVCDGFYLEGCRTPAKK
jgi:vesicle-associated membrane protein 7